MTLKIKLCLSLLLHFTICCNTHCKEIIITDDKPYEVINVTIPRIILKQALQPTPVLRSPVTITIPIHVEEENEIEEELQDEVQDEVQDVIVEDVSVPPEVIENEQEVISPVQPPVSAVTQNPIQQDEDTSNQGNVTGAVSRYPCSCPSGQCGCCTGAILDRINMKACGNISFVPEDFVFDVRLSVNNNTVVRRRVSASDPPPICFNPGRAPFVRVCAELSNIRIRNRNAFACLDINADVGGFPVYSASFRCFGLGSSGLQTGLKPKPVSSGPTPVNLFGNNDDDDRGSFLENAAGTVLGGGNDGLFGGSDGGLFGGGSSGGLFGGGSDNDDGGPLDAIGDAVGNIFEKK